jgi:hypothetical protein
MERLLSLAQHCGSVALEEDDMQADDHEPIASPHDFLLRYSRLPLTNFEDVGPGVCQCSPRSTSLIRKGTLHCCKACALLRQAYPTMLGERVLRLGLGTYLFVSPDKVRYWGNHRLNAINPEIECGPSAKQMTRVIRGLVRSPPVPPWLFICFGASTNARSLRLTVDPNIVRFSGSFSINDVPITEINRAQVMTLAAAGVTRKDWDAYYAAYVRAAPPDVAVMRELEARYPVLTTFSILPPKYSSEYVVFRWLLTETQA